MDKTGLKPCPFCGNEYPMIEHEYYTDTVKICCPHCQSEFSLDCTAGHNRDKDKLIKAWNRRSDNENRW